MRKLVIAVVLLAAMGLAAPVAQAGPVLSWVELGFKSSANGLVYDNPYDPDSNGWPPAGAVFSPGFLATGLGTVTFTFSGAGGHFVAGLFDYQFVDPANNNGLDDEYGVLHGGPGLGQSWEIDDSFLGSLFPHFYAFDGATPLLNSNGLPSTNPGDVAVGLGYAFTLAAGDPAKSVIFTVSRSAPSGYYLEQNDPLSGEKVYFSQSVGGGPVIPEPGTLTLVGLGLAAAARRLRRRA
jgi:hypothetical protein